MLTQRIALVVFDLAGTTVDHGCFAPVAPFVEALKRHGVDVGVTAVRAPMGLGKLDHLRALLTAPGASAMWRARHGADVTDGDIEHIYSEDFVPLQIECVTTASELIPGTLSCVAALRERGIAIGTTTGYFGAAAELCWAAAADQGFVADCSVHSEQVSAGRPAPWMIYRIMETLDVYPPRSVVKVGDTIPDIEEGLNAGAWAVGVSHTGSELGLSEAGLAALPDDERNRRTSAVSARLLGAGAHFVIQSVRDLPRLLPTIEKHMQEDRSASATGGASVGDGMHYG